jgi:very-short-patch-repair endonuclease
MAKREAIERARRLRRGQTQAEAALWRVLRNRRLDGFKFRRQVVIDRYIVDFACVDARLVVEVDGHSHGARTAADAVRTRALEACGYQVIRFWNPEIAANLAGVAETIRGALHPCA